MEAPNLVRVVAAFVAGVVIALGSALIYVRVSEMVRSQPVALAQLVAEPAQSAPLPVHPVPVRSAVPEIKEQEAVPDAPAAAPVKTAPTEEQEPTPRPIPKPKQLTVKLATHRQIWVGTPARQQRTIALVQAADTTPVSVPANYEPEPASAPAADVPPTTPSVDQTPTPQPHVVTLQAGTLIAIRLSETLSTDHNYTGDTFRGTLDAPVISDGFVIADVGSKVLGRVVDAEKAGRVEGTAEINLTLTEINTTDGQRIHVETGPWERRGPTSVGEDAAKIAGGAALGAIIGAMAGGGKGAAIGAGIGGAAGTGAVLSTRGKAVNLPVETRLSFKLATPLTLTEKLN